MKCYTAEVIVTVLLIAENETEACAKANDYFCEEVSMHGKTFDPNVFLTRAIPDGWEGALVYGVDADVTAEDAIRLNTKEHP